MVPNHSQTKTLLVTGGAGFIGSHFVDLALNRGMRVVVLDALTYAGDMKNLAEAEKHKTFRFVEGNIGNANLVKEILHEAQVTAVLNFAAESHVDRSIDGPAEFIQTNIVGTFQLLNQALQYWDKLPADSKDQFRFLQVSTDEVYGALGESGYFTESSPYQPNSPYSASKASADLLVRAWHKTYGLPTITTNCSNNFGPRQFPEKLIPLMIRNALEEKPLPVYGNGRNVRDWIQVVDHCRGIELALTRGTPGKTYCFGGEAERANIDVVQFICSTLDEIRPRKNGEPHKDLIQYVKDRLGHDWRYAIDSRLAREELGFKVSGDFEHHLKQTVEWYVRTFETQRRTQ